MTSRWTFSIPNGPKINTKNVQKSSCCDALQDRSKTAPDHPNTTPRHLPDLLRTRPRSPQIAQDGSKIVPRASRTPAGLAKKQRASKSSKKCLKKVDSLDPLCSLAMVPRTGQESFRNGRTPQGGGGGRAQRSSINLPFDFFPYRFLQVPYRFL